MLKFFRSRLVARQYNLPLNMGLDHMSDNTRGHGDRTESVVVDRGAFKVGCLYPFCCICFLFLALEDVLLDGHMAEPDAFFLVYSEATEVPGWQSS